MRKVVKLKFNGEDHFAMWSSVVMGLVTDYMPKKAMRAWLYLNYPRITTAAITAALESAVHEDEVGWK